MGQDSLQFLRSRRFLRGPESVFRTLISQLNLVGCRNQGLGEVVENRQSMTIAWYKAAFLPLPAQITIRQVAFQNIQVLFRQHMTRKTAGVQGRAVVVKKKWAKIDEHEIGSNAATQKALHPNQLRQG